MNAEYNELAQLVWDIKIGNKTVDEVIAWISVTDRRVEVIVDDSELSDEELADIEVMESLDCFGIIEGDDFED